MENNKQFPLWWCLIPILLLTMYLGTNYLVGDAMWMDEWFTYLRSGGGPFEPYSIPKIIQQTTIFLNWPPGYYLTFAGWTNTFGGTTFADRLFSLLLGLLTVCVMYRLGKEIHSGKFGLLLALLLSSSAFFIYYSHELRAYTLYFFSVTLSAWLYWKLLKTPEAGKGIAWGFALSIGLALYTHYLASLCVLAIGLYHLLFARPQIIRKQKGSTASIEFKHWIRIVRLGINGCLLFTPWIGVMLISVYNETLAPRSEPLPTMLYNIGFSFTNGMIWLLLLILITLRRPNRAINFAWLWILTVIGLTILGNSYVDFLFHPRHVLGILPMILLLLGFTLLQIAAWKREVAGLILGLWLGMGILHSLAPLPFMEQIPAHRSGIAHETNDTIVAIGETCIQTDDVALYGIYYPEDARDFDTPLNNYLVNVDYLYNHVSSIVSDVEKTSFLFGDTFTDDFFRQPPHERLQQITNNVDTLWVLAIPELPLTSELLELHGLLLTESFIDCGTFLDRPDLLGRVYSRDSQACQRLVSSCSGY